MALNDFKNIENINLNIDSQAQLIESKDLAIFKTSAKTVKDFGMSKNDVIEFRIYDISNNLLEQKNGKKVKYINKDQFTFYLKEDIDTNGEKILTIDVEKLIKEAGYLNGEFKIVFSFLKNFLGTNNSKQRVWIHEVAPSRTEIRVLPLITTDTNQNNFIQRRYNAFLDNGLEFKNYYDAIKKALDNLELTITDIIETYFVSIYGKLWVDSIKKDFFVNDSLRYDNLKKKIFLDFKNSVYYFIDGKEYDLKNPNYGKQIKNSSELDEFFGINEIYSLLSNRLTESIEYNLSDIKFVAEEQKLTTETNVKQSDSLKELLDTSFTTKSNLTQKDKLTISNPKQIEIPIIIDEEPIIKFVEPKIEAPIIEYGPPIQTDVTEEPIITPVTTGDPQIRSTNVEAEIIPTPTPIGGGPGRTLTYVNQDGEQETKTINLTYDY